MEKKYYYLNGINKIGPITLEEFKQTNLDSKTLIWYEGLNDWQQASEISELKEILELIPPPINNNESYSDNNKLENKIETYELNEPPNEYKIASKGWIYTGFILVLLGGFGGIIIGLNYAMGKYNKETKRIGWIMTILGFISRPLWKHFLK